MTAASSRANSPRSVAAAEQAQALAEDLRQRPADAGAKTLGQRPLGGVTDDALDDPAVGVEAADQPAAEREQRGAVVLAGGQLLLPPTLVGDVAGRAQHPGHQRARLVPQRPAEIPQPAALAPPRHDPVLRRGLPARQQLL